MGSPSRGLVTGSHSLQCQGESGSHILQCQGESGSVYNVKASRFDCHLLVGCADFTHLRRRFYQVPPVFRPLKQKLLKQKSL